MQGDIQPSSAAPDASAASRDDTHSLREELLKWRGRVPKLAAALRQRTEELEVLKGQLAAFRHAQDGNAVDGDAGIRIREELIGELEQKLETLDRSFRQAQGDLHARNLEVAALQDDVRTWKQKWQSLAQTLDEQAQTLTETREERDALHARNEKLFETTELANRQIEALADNLADLRLRTRDGDEREAALSRAGEEIRAENRQLAAEVFRLAGDLDALEAFSQTLCGAARSGAEEARAQQQRLEERSLLVAELERQHAEHEALARDLAGEKRELEDALLRAERQISENAEHITQLDDRLERQKTLLSDLEQELAEANGKNEARGAPSEAQATQPSESSADAAALKDKIRTLELMVREQTAELNRERWQRQFAESQGSQTADGNMLLVLNQQLEDARAANASLQERVLDLEEELTHIGMQRDGDDLTRIRGVGHKLASQLNEMGIYRLQQIAELDEQCLADEGHALHAHKGRILRDGWIEQAARLVSH